MSGQDFSVQRKYCDPTTDEKLFFLVRPTASEAAARRGFSEKDLSLLALHGVLRICATTLPPSRWSAVCQWTSAFRAIKHHHRNGPDFSARAKEILGWTDEQKVTNLQRSTHRRLNERYMTYLRERFSNSSPATEIKGLEHIRRSLDLGRGAILWNTPALGDTIVTKRALAAVDMRAYQLSVRSHGFAQSKFAQRFLNPHQIAVEDRYLAGRIWFDGADAVGATRDVVRKLRQNIPVLFTNSLHSGRAFVGVRVGNSYVLPLPTTPLSMAAKSGVPLHVVTTVEQVPFSRYTTEISEDLSIGSSDAGLSADDDRIAKIAIAVRDILLSHLRSHPDQVRLWDRLFDIRQFDAAS